MIVVGVTGHRVLGEPDRIRDGVNLAIRRIEQHFPGNPLTVVSALAEGADRLVASEILARAGGRLVAVLPFPISDYLTDFKSTDSRDEFSSLIERADEVIELQPAPTRDESYEAAGEYVAVRCNVLIAVWDGKKAQGKGGTAAIVGRARQRRIPICWIKAGNRKPGTMESRSLGADQGTVVFENF